MAKRMIVLVKGPNRKRGWLIAAENDDPINAVGHFLMEDPNKGDDTLREYLGLEPGAELPTQIEIKTTDLYLTRLRIQASWRDQET